MWVINIYKTHIKVLRGVCSGEYIIYIVNIPYKKPGGFYTFSFFLLKYLLKEYKAGASPPAKKGSPYSKKKNRKNGWDVFFVCNRVDLIVSSQ